MPWFIFHLRNARGDFLAREPEVNAAETEPLTFPGQLAVVGLLAGYDLLHQLVVAAVAHCLHDVVHLQTDVEAVGPEAIRKANSPAQRKPKKIQQKKHIGREGKLRRGGSLVLGAKVTAAVLKI